MFQSSESEKVPMAPGFTIFTGNDLCDFWCRRWATRQLSTKGIFWQLKNLTHFENISFSYADQSLIIPESSEQQPTAHTEPEPEGIATHPFRRKAESNVRSSFARKFFKVWAASSVNFLSLQTESNPAIAGLAHAHRSNHLSNGCTSAVPFSVKLDSAKAEKNLTDTVLPILPTVHDENP